MNDYPRMLYRKAGSDAPEIHGYRCDTRVVEDADEEAAVVGEGWRRSPAEAHGKEGESIVPDTPEAHALQDERDELLQEVEDLKAENAKLSKLLGEATAERDELTAQIADLTAPAGNKAAPKAEAKGK